MPQFYKETTLVIEYISKNGRKCKLTTNLFHRKVTEFYDSKIDVLFDKNMWTSKVYKKKYKSLMKTFCDICVLIKVYNIDNCVEI
jgi:hypothetical protein